MKTFLFLSLLTTFSFTSNAQAEALACNLVLDNHMQTIAESEKLIENLASHSNTITAFEITQLQKSLTTRFKSIKNFLLVRSDKNLNCAPAAVTPAIAIYDFYLIGKNVFGNDDLRRVVRGFIKHKPYELSDLITYYQQFTNHALIDEVEYLTRKNKIPLPAGVVLKKSKLDYDPNLFAASDKARNGTTAIVAGGARVWGFVSDKLKWREGRLNNDKKATELVRSNLRPLDLIYEKRTFTLSNYTIPGHWGHVGVWLGTKEELIKLGVWDEEFFKPFKAQVEAGNNIVEIRKEGLVYQSLDSFINLDEIAINRVEGITLNALNVFKEMTEQDGKKYDFKFDARTIEKLTCTELITFSYGDIKWHETKTLFQVSSRPDDLAELTLDSSSPVKFVLYLKGNKDGNGFKDTGFNEWSQLFKN